MDLLPHLLSAEVFRQWCPGYHFHGRNPCRLSLPTSPQFLRDLPLAPHHPLHPRHHNHVLPRRNLPWLHPLHLPLHPHLGSRPPPPPPPNPLIQPPFLDHHCKHNLLSHLQHRATLRPIHNSIHQAQTGDILLRVCPG